MPPIDPLPFQFASTLVTRRSKRRIAVLFKPPAWEVRMCAWTDYELIGDSVELVLEGDSPILFHGNMADAEVSVERILAVLSSAGIGYSAECYGPDGELIREWKREAACSRRLWGASRFEVDASGAGGDDRAGTGFGLVLDQKVLSMRLAPMQTELRRAGGSKRLVWTGRVLSGLAAAFLLFDGGAKIAKVAPVLEACRELEIPEWVIPRMGVLLVAVTILYAIPRTSVLGAMLVTGYLGGATWVHVRMGQPVFPMLFPAILGCVVWGGLYLREPRLRALVPLKAAEAG